MQIDEKGYILSSSEDIVKSIETELQKKFGNRTAKEIRIRLLYQTGRRNG